jgi:hypothetical protein
MDKQDWLAKEKVEAMPRRAEFIPKIEAELRKARKPISTQDIAAKIGCSNQQVHKAVTGNLAANVTRAGKSPTGGYLYAWRELDVKPDLVTRVVGKPRKGTVQEAAAIELGDVYAVVEVRVRKTGATVVLETKSGRQITVAS